MILLISSWIRQRLSAFTAYQYSLSDTTDSRLWSTSNTVLTEIWRLIQPRSFLFLFSLLLVLIRSGAGLVLPYMNGFLLDRVFVKHDSSSLVRVAAIIAVAAIVQAIVSLILNEILSQEAQRMVTTLREQVQRRIGRLPISYYDRNRTGGLVSRIVTDVEGVRYLVSTGIADFTGGIVTAVAAFIILAKADFKLTIGLFIVLISFTYILRQGLASIKQILLERSQMNANISGRLTESFAGVRVIKGYHAEAREAHEFSVSLGLILANFKLLLRTTNVLTLSASVLLGLVGSSVVFFGGRAVLTSHLTTGGYFQYTAVLAFMIAPVFQLVSIATQVTEAAAGLSRTMEVLAEREEFDDPQRTINLPRIIGTIEFNSVCFSYATEKPVLKHISFNASPGSVTAFVGSSGSGKSTILSLICAFHKPESGKIFVDDIDLSKVKLETYRTQLGVVFQESFLFDGSIRANIMFSSPNATEADFANACRIARIDEFASQLQEGYDTIIGERGVKLSGGQRQRLSIARAILADPRILILDEATASLDSESEMIIQQSLSALLKGRTTFVIAHRFSTIRNADRIIVVEAGEIVEHGTHDNLYACRGRYYELCRQQQTITENLFVLPS